MTESYGQITKSQQKVLQFVRQFLQDNGYSPSYREVMHGLQYKSVSTVAVHVNALRKHGFLTPGEMTQRSLALPDTAQEKAPGFEAELLARLQAALAQSDTTIDFTTLTAILKLIHCEQVGKKLSLGD